MNETNILFSVVVPVYNVEKYLSECLESILNQTYEDFELILVDDGSLDNSGVICDEYSKKDSRIKVIHKKNGGLLSAWVSGLEITRGTYIGSIDSDDYVEVELFEKIENVIREARPDIIVYGYKSVNDSRTDCHEYTIPLERGLYEGKRKEKDIIPYLINRGCFEERSCIYLSRVNKFVKADLLKRNTEFYYSGVNYGEDNLWTIPNIIKADSVYVMSDYYPYSYRYNPNSITHSVNKGLWREFVLLDNHIITMLNKLGADNIIRQVYCDSVFHAAIAINNIVLEELRRKDIVSTIDEILSNGNVINGLKYMNPEYCSFKERINLFLMKHKAINTIFVIKRLQKKHFKRFMR